jgi:membrane associated rhomboid family serine protease
MLPIRDDNPTSGTAWVTLVLISLNVAAFLFWQPTFASGPAGAVRTEVFLFCHAEIPWEVSHQTTLADGGAAARQALRDQGIQQAAGFQQFLRDRCGSKSWLASVFVAMFLHAGWLHLGGNMLFLWVFGNNVEDRLGRIRYLLFYLASGVAATLGQLAVDPNSVVPNLGASGAIAGVLGAYLVMFPRRRVLTLVFFFIITWVYVPAVVVLAAWFVLQLFSGIGGLARHATGGGVAYFAHIGGFAFGALVAWVFFPKEGLGPRPPPRRPGRVGGPWNARRLRPPPRADPSDGP